MSQFLFILALIWLIFAISETIHCVFSSKWKFEPQEGWILLTIFSVANVVTNVLNGQWKILLNLQ
jgi:hypothetical protein